MTTLRLTDDERASGLSGERLALALRTLRDTGLVTLENVYDEALLAAVREQFHGLAAAHVASKGGWDALVGKTFGEKHLGFFPPMVGPIADELVAAHPASVSVLNASLGGDPQCSFFHTNTCYPGSGVQPIHRDQGHLFGTETDAILPVTHIVVNIPLIDFTIENGATEVWPGTHRVTDREVAEGKELESRASGWPSLRTVVPAGSVILRDLRLWHRGMPNTSADARTMMAIVYVRGWLAGAGRTVPRSTWDSWSESAQRIFRSNRVVDDAGYTPRTWEDK